MSLRVRHPHPIKIKIRRIYMKKKSSIILLFVLAIVTSLCFFGCKKDNGPDNPTPMPTPAKASITLDKTSLNLDVYESAVLNATAKNVTETLVWSSSNSAVATVDGGKVTAVGAGEATVTVSGSGASATCAVTVTDSHTAPVLRVEHSEIAVALNGTYDLKIETLWKGAAITDPINYVWSYADGQPEDVVSVENIATGARFTGLKYGSTELYVKADVRGTKLVQKISVKVCNVDITFEITNLTKGETYYEANVALIGTETDPASITPDVKIYDKQTLVDNPAITWTVADDTVANITNGVITALKEGETLAHASYENNDITILVKAYRPIVTLADEVTLETINGTFAITSDIQGAISGVTIADVNVMSSVSGKNFTLDKAKLPKDGAKLGAQKITIETDKAKYVINANIYTKILKTADDILNWQTLAHEQETDLKFWNGYFVLGNDIDMTGKQFNGIFDYYSMNSSTTWQPLPGYEGMVIRDGTTGGFRGTFDGNGYTISNLKIKKLTDSLVGQMTPQGVVKNLTFTGAEIGAGAALVSIGGNGTIENVYAEIAAYANGTHVNDRTAVFSQLGKSGAKIKNCVAVFKCATAQSPYFVGMACAESDGVLDGVYGINIDKSYAITSTTASPGVYGAYMSFGALKASGVDFSSWAGEYWQIINGIPYPKKLALPEANTPAATAPATSGIGKDITVSGLSSNDAIKLSDEAAALGVTVSDNVISVPASVASGTEISFTVYNVFDESKKVDITVLIAESANIALEGKTNVVVKDGNDFEVDFGDKAGEVDGNIESVTVDGAEFASKTFANGKLTLDTQTLGAMTGAHTVNATFVKRNGTTIEKITYVSFDIDVTTMMIRTEADLNNFINVSKEFAQGNSWLGLFKLANDITCEGTYAATYVPGDGRGDIGVAVGFNGTFDGQGYTIYNFRPVGGGDLAGLTGQLGQHGTIKNVSFVNAEANGEGSVIAVISAGTVENVYVHVKSVVDNGQGWAYGTAIITNDAFGTARFRNVIVEYANTLPSTNVTGYPIYNYNGGYGIMNGVYAVGASKIYGNLASDQGADVGAAFADYAALKAAGVTLENDFWTMVDGIPAPKKLAQNAGASVVNAVVSIPSSQRKLTVESNHPFIVYSLDEAALAAGLTISGNVVTIPETVTVSSFTVTAKSLLNAEVTASKTFYIVSSEVINVADRKEVEMQATEDVIIDLTSYNVSGNLTSAKLGGTAIDLANVTFESGTLTIARSAFGNVYGEKALELTFEAKSGEVVTKITTVNADMLFVTKYVSDAADLTNLLNYTVSEGGYLKGGYFVQSANITLTSGRAGFGDWSSEAGAWVNQFTGVYDGQGYIIDGMTQGTNAGLFGHMNGGTVKNVVFTKAVLNGNGGFVVTELHGGVIENVAVYGSMGSGATGQSWSPNSMLVGKGIGGTIKNCYVELSSHPFSGTGNAGMLVGTLSGATVQDCIAVNLKSGENASIQAIGPSLTGNTDTATVKTFASLDAAKEYGLTADFSTWSTDFWTVTGGRVHPKNLSIEDIEDPYGLKNKTELTIAFSNGQYYNSTNNTSIAGDWNIYACTTNRFTREDIPVGSVIYVASGWGYRPEGWVNDALNTNATRPGEVSATYVVVTEEWWSNYTVRAFNLFKTDKSDISTYTDSLPTIFKIYVPNA